mgnify:CR=1 FL=1
MKVTITGRQMNVWSEMEATIEKKLAKLDKFFDETASGLVQSDIDNIKEYFIDSVKTDQETAKKYFDDWDKNTTPISWITIE